MLARTGVAGRVLVAGRFARTQVVAARQALVDHALELTVHGGGADRGPPANEFFVHLLGRHMRAVSAFEHRDDRTALARFVSRTRLHRPSFRSDSRFLYHATRISRNL